MAVVETELLAREAVVTGLPSVTKTQAIEFVGAMLVERGHICLLYTSPSPRDRG